MQNEVRTRANSFGPNLDLLLHTFVIRGNFQSGCQILHADNTQGERKMCVEMANMHIEMHASAFPEIFAWAVYK